MPDSPQAVRHCAILTCFFSAAELAHQFAEQQHKAHHQQNDGEDQTEKDKGKAVGLFQQRGKAAAVLYPFCGRAGCCSSPARCRCRRRRCPRTRPCTAQWRPSPSALCRFSVRITSSKSSMGVPSAYFGTMDKCRRTYPSQRSASARCKGLLRCGTACRPAAPRAARP